MEKVARGSRRLCHAGKPCLRGASACTEIGLRPNKGCPPLLDLSIVGEDKRHGDQATQVTSFFETEPCHWLLKCLKCSLTLTAFHLEFRTVRQVEHYSCNMSESTLGGLRHMYAQSIRMTAAAGDGSDSGERVHNSSFQFYIVHPQA